MLTISMSSLEKCLFMSLVHFHFFFILSHMSCLYFKYYPLLVMQFANIFSHSVGYCWFCLLCKSFNFNQFPFIFALEDRPPPSEYHYNLYQRMFCLCYLLRILVSSLIFSSLIHFKIIFVYGVRECSGSNFPSMTYWREVVEYILAYFVIDW